jgi:NADP-dependent 3-hydroxy acid dehydrogenase YdfG
MKTDMSNLTHINAMVANTVDWSHRHPEDNARVNKQLDFFEVTERDWDWIHSINAKGLFFRMQTVAREMAKNNYGEIINAASIGGKGFRGTSHRVFGLQGSSHRNDPHRRLAARPLQHQCQRYLSWRYTLGDV